MHIVFVVYNLTCVCNKEYKNDPKQFKKVKHPSKKCLPFVIKLGMDEKNCTGGQKPTKGDLSLTALAELSLSEN